MRGEEGCRSPQTGLQSLEPHIYGAAINGLWTATIYIYIYIVLGGQRGCGQRGCASKQNQPSVRKASGGHADMHEGITESLIHDCLHEARVCQGNHSPRAWGPLLPAFYY